MPQLKDGIDFVTGNVLSFQQMNRMKNHWYSGATPPDNPVAGMIWVKNDGVTYVYFGAAWVELAGGVATFLELTDTPGAYAGEGGKFVKVNAVPDALEFAAIVWGDVSKAGSNLTDLATRQHAGLTNITSDQHHAQLHAASHANGQGDELSHNALKDYAVNQHRVWEASIAQDIHDDNIPSSAVTQHEGDIDHNALTNYAADQHLAALDEDDLVSDSDTNVATQQSIKAYVDALPAASDEKVKVDAAATAGYLGIVFGDGVLRVTENELTYADGGDFITLGLADHNTARTALGLAIGTDVQAYHASLASIAGLSYVSGSFIALTGADTYAVRTYAQVLSDIGAQASDASLTSIAGLTYVSASFIKMTAGDTYAVRTIAETITDLSHASSHLSAGADSIKLDDLAAPDDNADLDFSTSLHGLVPKGVNLGRFLKDDGTWATPAGGGDVTAASNFGADNQIIRADGTGKGVQSSNPTIDDSGWIRCDTGLGVKFQPVTAVFNLIRSYTAQYEAGLHYGARYPIIYSTASTGAHEFINHLGTSLFAIKGANGQAWFSNNLNVAGALDVVGIQQFHGQLYNYGGCKLGVQNQVDGGNSKGIFMWATTDPNWGIYMGQAGGSKSLAGTAACSSLSGRSAHHIRFRVASGVAGGFIWENNSDNCLMSLDADSGRLYLTSDINLAGATSTITGGAALNIEAGGTGVRSQTVHGDTTLNASDLEIADFPSFVIRRSTSGRKYKDKIKNLELDPSLIYNLLPRSFNSKCKGDDKNKRYIGLLADEIEPFYPEIIKYNKDKEADNYDHRMLMTLILAETQRHEARIKALEVQLNF